MARFEQLEALVVEELAHEIEHLKTGQNIWPDYLMDYLIRVGVALRLAMGLLDETNRGAVKMMALEIPGKMHLEKQHELDQRRLDEGQ